MRWSMGCLQSKKKTKTLDRDESELLKSLTNFSAEELQRCFQDFTKESPSGEMNREQFEDTYVRLFTKDNERKFVDHLFRTFDFDGNGKINFKEFVCGLSVATRGSPDEKLMWTFNVYDVNKDGAITRDEMTEIMRAIYAINGVSEPEQLENGNDAFDGLDSNDDGKISVAEFIKGVKRDKRLVDMLKETTDL